MTNYQRLMARLRGGAVVVLDGPTGTELQKRGAPMDPAAWCGPATLGNDALLTEIHADYIAAGAEISFGLQADGIAGELPSNKKVNGLLVA
jgi:S-methylmethionine-dependent homocysteine/selenocysteine methylase